MQPLHCHTEQRIQAIRQLFRCLEQGDCSMRLGECPDNDRISRLERELNRIAAEFSAVIQESGYVATPLQNDRVPPLPAPPTGSSAMRFELIRDIHHFILNSLEDPLPSVREIAKMFGTNECTLKRGFHSLFGTSVHRFYNEHRLLLAHELITGTSEPLKSIQKRCGFKVYRTFARAIKKKYRYAPASLKRLGSPPDVGFVFA